MIKIFAGIERGRGTIEIDGTRISLPAKSYEYIVQLAFCLDRTMSHEELEPAEPSNTMRYVCNLRKQLGKHKNIIERVRNVGYRLNYDGMIAVEDGE